MTQPEETGYIADKIVKAEKRIKAYPYDTEAWSVLIRDAQMRKMEEGRGLFERLVEQFPNAGKYWKLYIEQEVTIPFFSWPFPLSSICQTFGTWLRTDPRQFVVEIT